MVFALVVDVVDHPSQVLRSEAHDPVTRLPLQAFAHLERAATFQLSDPFIKVDRRLYRTADMNVVFEPPMA